MKITHNLTIDLQRRGNLQKIDVVQGDTYTRLVNISLYNNGVLWDMPTDSIILVRYHKPDGTTGIYEALPDGSPAGVVDGNGVLITLAPQMLTAPGEVPTQVSIVADDQVLSTFSFIVDVEEDPSKGTVRSENYHSWKTAFIPQTSGAVVGQYLKISSVDAEGRVKSVEPVNNPTVVTEMIAARAEQIAKNAEETAKESKKRSNEALETAKESEKNSNEALEAANYANDLSVKNSEDIQNLFVSKMPQVTGAKVGQYIKITEVDDLGRVVAFKAVNAPTSGSISGDLEMQGDVINNVGSISFIGPSNTSVDGFWIQSGAAVSNEDGSKMAVVEFYSSDTDDNVVIRNVAPGVEDRDAVNMAQLSEKISSPIGEVKVGQTIVVKEVDADGKPTVWEAVDFPSGGGGNVVEILNLTIAEETQYVFHPFSFELYDVVFVKIVQTENTQAYFSFNDDVLYFIVSQSLYNHADLTIFQIDKERAFAAYNTGYSLSQNAGISNAAGNTFKGGMTFDPVKTGLKIFKSSKWKNGDNIRIWGRLKA